MLRRRQVDLSHETGFLRAGGAAALFSWSLEAQAGLTDA
jgi:hypothetical protein